MQINEQYAKLADDATIQKTAEALKKNGISAVVVETEEEAKKKVLELLPQGSEVMNMTSMTLEAINVVSELNESEHFNSVHNKLNAMDQKTQGAEMRRLGAAPEWVVGSVHAVTEDGHVLVASASGSQLPAYAYAAGHVIWVIGTQKIVKNIEEGMKRIYEYSFPLEDERALKAYGMHSGVNKILIVNKEFVPERITAILVKKKLGF
ncbi:LUD domain-containing protein [Patescibacteria group bacterium]|nr:LUD domain-containing protein [Patescibacteria group bacterium]